MANIGATSMTPTQTEAKRTRDAAKKIYEALNITEGHFDNFKPSVTYSGATMLYQIDKNSSVFGFTTCKDIATSYYNKPSLGFWVFAANVEGEDLTEMRKACAELDRNADLLLAKRRIFLWQGREMPQELEDETKEMDARLETSRLAIEEKAEGPRTELRNCMGSSKEVKDNFGLWIPRYAERPTYEWYGSTKSVAEKKGLPGY